eukprot:gene643-8146_t
MGLCNSCCVTSEEYEIMDSEFLYRYDENMRRRSNNLPISKKLSKERDVTPPSIGAFYDDNQGILKTYNTPGDATPKDY